MAFSDRDASTAAAAAAGLAKSFGFFGGGAATWNDRRKNVAKRSIRSSPTNRRASPEAVEKRRAARAFNETVLGPPKREGDGRTERRRRRLLKELASGMSSRGHELKPIEVLLHVQALIEMGESVSSLKEVLPTPPSLKPSPTLVDNLRRLHDAYQFAPDTYQFVGVNEVALTLAGIRTPKRGPVKARARPSSGNARRGAA